MSSHILFTANVPSAQPTITVSSGAIERLSATTTCPAPHSECFFEISTAMPCGKVAPIDLAGYDTFTIDLSNPIIIDDNGLKVTAFRVIHDPIEPALGFRFDYKGRSIVISGDTISTENTIKNSINADVLFHEAQANHIVKILENENKKIGNNLAAKIMADIVTYHTTPVEAAEIANQANVNHLVFYHLTPAPRNALMERMFVRGVNDIRKEWTLSDDGTLVILPANSEKIEITKIN